jgi:hypothetical protein
MQKLDMNTVAQGINSRLSDDETDFSSFIYKPFKAGTNYPLPEVAIIHYSVVFGNRKSAGGIAYPGLMCYKHKDYGSCAIKKRNSGDEGPGRKYPGLALTLPAKRPSLRSFRRK